MPNFQTPEKLGLVSASKDSAIQKNDLQLLPSGQLIEVPLEKIGLPVGDNLIYRRAIPSNSY